MIDHEQTAAELKLEICKQQACSELTSGEVECGNSMVEGERERNTSIQQFGGEHIIIIIL